MDNRRIEHALGINPTIKFQQDPFFNKNYPSKYVNDDFNLKAVILHKSQASSSRGGHYIAYVKRTTPNGVVNWFKCDDLSNISKVIGKDEISSIITKGHGFNDETLLPTIVIYERDKDSKLKS